MNDTARRIMRDRLMRRDGNHGGYGEYEGEYRGTYERDHAMEDSRRGRDRGEDYRSYDRGDMRRGDIGEDYRRGRGEDMRRGDRRDYGEDYRRDRGGYSRNRYGEFTGRDRGEEKTRMKPEDMDKWSEMLKNADGTKGAHFKEKHVMDVAKTLGINFEEYDPEEFVMVMNMLYSDYCEALRQFIQGDIKKEAMAYAKLAEAWLSDEDAASGSEKLALYYYCIVEQDV